MAKNSFGELNHTKIAFSLISYPELTLNRVLADISLKNNSFYSSGAFALGVLANLGDVQLENLTLKSKGVIQLADFQPSVKETEVEQQLQRLTKGVEIDKHIYKTSVHLKENSSYVLRVIAYKGRLLLGSGNNKTNILAKDERLDLLVVFRLIRKHEDGSVALLWKELDRKQSPKILLAEKEKQAVGKTNFLNNSER